MTIRFSILAVPAIILILLISSFLRNSIWVDEHSLWSDVAAKSVRRARAHLNLCVFYSGTGDRASAFDHCTQAIELDQTDFLTRDAYINRGALLSELGQYQNALQDYTSALHLAPDDWKIYNNVAYVHALQGNLEEALEQYSKAISLNPLSVNALFNRAILYEHLGRHRLAIDDFTRALAIDPASSVTYEKRGRARLAAGDRGAAYADFEQACRQGRQEACAELARLRP